MRNETVNVRHNMVVREGAHVLLLGVDLVIGEGIWVQENASLTLGPSGTVPTTIRPMNMTAGYWIAVDGNMVTQGVPKTTIQGLKGEGLASVLRADGGLQVYGTALLEDVAVNNGSAGLTVQHGGQLFLRRANLSSLGFIAVAALGELGIENSTVHGGPMAVSGRETCHIRVEDSVISSSGDNLLVNSCPTVVMTRTTLLGGQASFTANGQTNVTVRDSRLIGYRASGLSIMPLPGNGGGTRHGSLVGTNVTLEPATTARWGIELVDAAATLQQIRLSNHTSHGIQSLGATLDIASSVIQGNRGFGIYARSGHLLFDAVDFGSPAQGTTNDEGPVSKEVAFWATATHPNGTRARGLSLEVYDADHRTVFRQTDIQEDAIKVQFESYSAGPDGAPQYLGPFTFQATHSARSKPMEGDVPEGSYDLFVDLDYKVERPIGGILLLLGILGFGVLMAFGLFNNQFAVLFKRVRSLDRPWKRRGNGQ